MGGILGPAKRTTADGGQETARGLALTRSGSVAFVSSPKSRDLRIDDAAECIWRDGEKVGVPPKAFLVLRRLMERPAELVTKTELLEAVWPDTYVTDIVLNNAVGQLRQALGDNPKQPRFIETVHRRGFRWIGPVNAAAAPRASAFTDVEASAETAFVGRAESLAELTRCYTRAAAGQRQLVLVSGEPGIGNGVDRDTHGRQWTEWTETPMVTCVASHAPRSNPPTLRDLASRARR